MAVFRKKISPRRKQVRENITAERAAKIGQIINSGLILAVFELLLFSACITFLLSINGSEDAIGFKDTPMVAAFGMIVAAIAVGIGFYVYHYQRRIIQNKTRGAALLGLFVILVGFTKFGSIFPESFHIAVGGAITCSIVLTIAYDQRFAMGMSLFYAMLATLAAGEQIDMTLFMTMAAGALTCCFLLREIRTRMKLLEVSAVAAVIVFAMSAGLSTLLRQPVSDLIIKAGKASAAAVFVGVIIQALLPLIEKSFKIATSMTLLDYSDANQPLLKKLAMEAPGTFSHCLLIGTIAEAAAEAIGANGLLCRVGAYYHDIGKTGKPHYFVENQMGQASKHEQLSPAMSQLIIVGHVKDGIEMAKEYGLPAVIRQFIETHHGTSLIEYFYHEAKKKNDPKQGPPSESEFRYPGPKPQTKEAAIVMLADGAEGAVRSLGEITPTKIETVVHNMAMKRLQDEQFDECELTLRELSQIETAMSKSLAAHYHSRIAYPKPMDKPQAIQSDEQRSQVDNQ